MDLNQKFYHCCPILLESGSIINPGNYGRILTFIGETHQSWHREVILENYRLKNFPEKPSRLKSAFVCETIEAATLFKNTSCMSGIIYEVEIIDRNAPTHRADFNCVDVIPTLRDMQEVANHYWNFSYRINVAEYPNVDPIEILTLSSLRIIRQLL